jgi:hypothetical protein
MSTKLKVMGNAAMAVEIHDRVYKGPAGHVVVPTYSSNVPNSDKRRRLKKAYSSRTIKIYESDTVTPDERFQVDINTGNYVHSVIWQFVLTDEQLAGLTLVEELHEEDFVIALQQGFTSVHSSTYAHSNFGDIQATLFFQAVDNSKGIAIAVNKFGTVVRWSFTNTLA